MEGDARPSLGSSIPTQIVAVTSRLATGDSPQALVAVTVTAPPVEPAVAVMDSVVEAPVHPPGNVQM
jgi:hypothetical protein